MYLKVLGINIPKMKWIGLIYYVKISIQKSLKLIKCYNLQTNSLAYIKIFEYNYIVIVLKRPKIQYSKNEVNSINILKQPRQKNVPSVTKT